MTVTAVPDSTLPPGNVVILVVEDDDALRALVRRVLSRHGYNVLATADPLDAIAMLESAAARIDLVLTDLVMSTLDGLALARRVRRRHPTMRMLFMSGYDERTVREAGADAGHLPFLPKPFTPQILVASVRAALATPVDPHVDDPRIAPESPP